MFNEGNQIHNFMSSSGSGTVINYGSDSDFLTSYSSGSGSGSTSPKVTVPTVPVPVPVPQHWYSDGYSAPESWPQSFCLSLLKGVFREMFLLSPNLFVFRLNLRNMCSEKCVWNAFRFQFWIRIRHEIKYKSPKKLKNQKRDDNLLGNNAVLALKRQVFGNFLKLRWIWSGYGSGSGFGSETGTGNGFRTETETFPTSEQRPQ